MGRTPESKMVKSAQVALILFGVFCILPLCVKAESREFRGVWIATHQNIDWPAHRGMSSLKQQRSLTYLFDVARDLRLNAVLFQVRPDGDTLYPSDYEPWSAVLSGKQGEPPLPIWDPVDTAVQLAHERGLEFHAWFNPYRVGTNITSAELDPKSFGKTHPESLRTYGKYLWLDPGDPIVVVHTLNVITELIEKYDVDGIHLDDYFYPYPINDAKGVEIDFPDQPTWKKYGIKTGLSKSDWRRKNVSDFIQALYERVRSIPKQNHVKVGISPFGLYRPGSPDGEGDLDQFKSLYADPLLWMQKGWLDYLAPQIYWKYGIKKTNYSDILAWWLQPTVVNLKGRHVWPGISTSSLNDRTGWTNTDIIDEIDEARKQKAGGTIQFSMGAFLGDEKINHALIEGPFQELALAPETPWLATDEVGAPVIVSRTKSGMNLKAEWKQANSSDQVRFYALSWVHPDKTKKLFRISSKATVSAEIPAEAQFLEVLPLGKTEKAGPSLVVSLK